MIRLGVTCSSVTLVQHQASHTQSAAQVVSHCVSPGRMAVWPVTESLADSRVWKNAMSNWLSEMVDADHRHTLRAAVRAFHRVGARLPQHPRHVKHARHA